MSAQPDLSIVPFSHFEQLREAREIIRLEAAALETVAAKLDASFCAAVDAIKTCTGKTIVTGMGKAGLIGRKMAATFASTGTRSHFLHPAEAVHGDLGVLHPDDVVLMLSNSGETEEVCRLLPIVRRCGNTIIALTGRERSTLGAEADVTIVMGKLREAGQLGLAPTTSTTAMLAVGDALALVVSRIKGFTQQQFARFHPAGALGQQLLHVADVMRKGDQLRIAPEASTIREVFAQGQRPGRRTGAVMLVDADGRLAGLFTDSDLARLLERRREDQLDRPVAEVMTKRPVTITPSAPLADAIQLLSTYHISELPVIDDHARPTGLIDITDVVALLPPEAPE